jgi:hypothetical protein
MRTESAAAARVSSAHGTLFFTRRISASDDVDTLSIKPGAGKAVHKIFVGEPVYPARKVRRLITTKLIGTAPAEFELVTKTYSGRTLHTYTPKNPRFGLQSTSPDAHYLGLVEPTKAGNERSVIATAKGRTVATLPIESPYRAAYESWNPAGTELAIGIDSSASGDNAVKIFTAHGRLVRTLWTGTALLGTSWSSNATIAFAVGNRLETVSDRGGKIHTILKLPGSRRFFDGVSCSANGADIAYGESLPHAPGDVLMLATANGKHHHEINGSGTLPQWG